MGRVAQLGSLDEDSVMKEPTPEVLEESVALIERLRCGSLSEVETHRPLGVQSRGCTTQLESSSAGGARTVHKRNEQRRLDIGHAGGGPVLPQKAKEIEMAGDNKRAPGKGGNPPLFAVDRARPPCLSSAVRRKSMPVDDSTPSDWKLKLRYGKVSTPYEHFAALAEGRMTRSDNDFDCPAGLAWMAMKTWASDTDESGDTIWAIGRQIGFEVTGRIHIYDTEPEQPPREGPFGYEITFTPFTAE